MFTPSDRRSVSRLSQARRRRAVHPGVIEVLEDRLTPSTFTVTTLADNSPGTPVIVGSLRAAVNDANASPGADTINYASGLNGATRVRSPINVTDPVTITAAGHNITLSANLATQQLFVITNAVTVDTFTLLTSAGVDVQPGGSFTGINLISNGAGPAVQVQAGADGFLSGGNYSKSPASTAAIINNGTLQLTGVMVASNKGDGLRSSGGLTIMSSPIVGNNLGGGTANLVLTGGTANLANSHFDSSSKGSGISATDTALSVSTSTVDANYKAGIDVAGTSQVIVDLTDVSSNSLGVRQNGPSSYVEITHSWIDINTAKTSTLRSQGYDGGVKVLAGNTVIGTSQILGNSWQGFPSTIQSTGPGIYWQAANSSSSFSLYSSTIGNTGVTNGTQPDGLQLVTQPGATIVVNTSTLCNNNAGIRVMDSSTGGNVTVTNSTIARNRKGVIVGGSAVTQFTFHSSILVNIVDDWVGYQVIVDQGYNALNAWNRNSLLFRNSTDYWLTNTTVIGSELVDAGGGVFVVPVKGDDTIATSGDPANIGASSQNGVLYGTGGRIPSGAAMYFF